MFIDLEKVSIFVRLGATDMRKAINGLSILVSESMEMNALSGSVFVFCSRNRKVLKALYGAVYRLAGSSRYLTHGKTSIIMICRNKAIKVIDEGIGILYHRFRKHTAVFCRKRIGSPSRMKTHTHKLGSLHLPVNQLLACMSGIAVLMIKSGGASMLNEIRHRNER